VHGGTKYPPCSVSNILDNWLRTVTRVSLSYTAIQAESNELFGVIIKRIFVKIFIKFQNSKVLFSPFFSRCPAAEAAGRTATSAGH